MAKRVKMIRLTLKDGTTRVIQVKTTTERYIRMVVSDMGLTTMVRTWEVL